jgi:hypothetical protein
MSKGSIALVDARDAAQRNRIGGAHHGDRAATPGAGTDPPLRSRHSVCRRALSAGPRAIRHYTLDSRKGDCLDNAPMESFFHSLKTERVHHRIYGTRAEAGRDLFQYIEGFYNSHRLHSTLGYISPACAERMAAKPCPLFRGKIIDCPPWFFCYSERITFQLRTSCSPPPALLTTGRPRVKCASSIASAQPAAIAFSLSLSKSRRGA